MHAKRKLRRLPAAQAARQHKKRLPSQGWPDEAAPIARQFTLTGPVTLTQVIPVPPTTTSSSSSSSSSAVAPVLTNTATFSPFTPPATPNPPTPPAPPATSSPAKPPTVSVISSGGNDNSTAAEGANTSQKPLSGVSEKQSSGLPTGAIVGITIAIVVIILGALVFFARQRAIRNRKLRRQTGTWISQPRPAEPAFTQMSTGMVSAGNMASVTMAPVPQAPTPPASSYNNPPPPVAAASIPASESALVRYEYIPSLPDELSITTGEVIRIVAEYDDGWALCANARGDQGMVPLECLDRSVPRPAPLSPMQADPVGGFRNSRRTSSLGVRY